MTEPFYDAITKSKIYQLFNAVNNHAFGDLVGRASPESLRINRAINKTLAGVPHEPGDMPDPSDFGEFAFRVHAVVNSLFELERMTNVFDAVPIRAIRMGASEQLQMFLGHYLNQVYALQEKLMRLWFSALPFAKGDMARMTPSVEERKIEKKRLIKKYLVDLKQVVDDRDRWIHDQPTLEYGLERLSLLEAYIGVSVLDKEDGDHYWALLKDERKKLLRKLKKTYSSRSSANSLNVILIVDKLVGDLMGMIDLPIKK